MSFTTPIAESDVTSLVDDLALKAPLASPTFTGHPVGVTESALNNSTRLATTAYIDTAVGVEATRATTAEALLAPKASPTLTGTVTVPNGAGATDLAAYGQLPTAGAVGGFGKVVFRTGDSATMSTSTFANDDTLLWAVGANDVWWVQAYCTFTAANGAGTATTADMKIGWSVPASGAMQWGWQSVNLTTTGVGYGITAVAGAPLAPRTTAQAATHGGDAVTWGALCSGYYTGGGTSGNVVMQWSQNTTNAATLQINKNSLLLCWRIA